MAWGLAWSETSFGIVTSRLRLRSIDSRLGTWFLTARSEGLQVPNELPKGPSPRPSPLVAHTRQSDPPHGVIVRCSFFVNCTMCKLAGWRYGLVDNATTMLSRETHKHVSSGSRHHKQSAWKHRGDLGLWWSRVTRGMSCRKATFGSGIMEKCEKTNKQAEPTWLQIYGIVTGYRHESWRQGILRLANENKRIKYIKSRAVETTGLDLVSCFI